MRNETDDVRAVGVGEVDVRDRPYCYTVLQYFRGRSADVATVEDLASFVNGSGGPDGSASDAAVRLHHVTLPRLADAGYLDYDPTTKTARFRGGSAGER